MSGLLPWLGPSALLHAGLIALLAGVGTCAATDRPPVERDAFMVSAVVLPKSDGLPTRAAAPRVAPGDAPKVEKAPAATPPPPEPDRMVLPQQDAPQREGPKATATPRPTEPPAPRPKLSELVAAVGDEADEVSFETSPDGDPNAKPEAGLRAQFGRQMTAYERQVKDLIQHNWFPKSSGGDPSPDAWAAVTFSIDDDGNLQDAFQEASSGDFVYDQSCLRAVQRTRRVPPPPPDANRTVTVGFSPKDKQ